MNKSIPITAHIKEMPSKTGDNIYCVEIHLSQGANRFVDNNNGFGYTLYAAQKIFAVLQKICVGEYEIPEKVVR